MTHDDARAAGAVPRVHELKTWPNYYDAVERGEKTFEVRRDDRGFQRGDILRLQRYDPKKCAYTIDHFGFAEEKRRSLDRVVSWVLTGGQFGVEPGYVVLALAQPVEADTGERGS